MEFVPWYACGVDKPLSFVSKLVAVICLIAVALLGFQAMWNWVIPDLFHGPELTFVAVVKLGMLLFSATVFLRVFVGLGRAL